MMRSLTLFLSALLVLAWMVNGGGAENGRYASVYINHPEAIFHNGDKVELTGENFLPGEKIVMVALTVIDERNQLLPDIFLRNYRLNVDQNGRLQGYVYLDALPVEAHRIEVLVFAEKSITRASQQVRVVGDGVTYYNSAAGIETAGTATIFDSTSNGGNGDGIADNSENITLSGSGWTGSLFGLAQREYSDISGTTFVKTTNLSTSNAQISGGVLSGYTTTTATYDASTVSIRIRVVNDGFEVTDSNVMLTPDTDPPGLISATAIALDTIRITFDEPVSETGNAHNNFVFGGTNGSGLVAGDLFPVGSQPTDTWKLYLSTGLTDRGVGDVTIAYNQSTTDSLYDAAGNQVENTSPAVSVSDAIPPAAPVLRNSANSANLTVGEYIGSGTYTLRARVENGNTDTSLDGVVFEGSDDGSNWTTIGTDGTPTANGNHADFEVSWDISTVGKFKMLRARAFDAAGAGGNNDIPDGDDNVTVGSTVGSATNGFNNNFKDTYRAIISSVNPSTILASSGSDRAEITVELQNNYGDAINTTGINNVFRLSETTTTTETWWDAATGGNSFSTQIDLTITSANTSGSVWYSNNIAGGPNTLVLTEPAGNFANHNGVVSANGQTVTVTTGTASKIWIRLPGQSFTTGTGVTGSPSTKTATDTIIARLYVTDDGNNLVTSFNETRLIDFSTTAGTAPDGTQPSVSHSTTLTDISVTFSGGTDTVTIRFPKAETGVTITASDATGSPALTGVTSSAVNINPGPLAQFAFVMKSPQRDGRAVTGTNTLTAQDAHQNVITTFNAATDNVTITGSGPGVATITGLGSGGNNVLDQATDFVSGVANLTNLGMTIDVTIIGNYTFTATSASGKTGQATNIAVNRVVTVSNPITAENTILDTTATGSDFLLSASLDGTEDSGVNDDFRIRWGFNNTGTAGSYAKVRTSINLTPGGTIQHTVPIDSIRNLGASYDYMFWWVENISTHQNATVLEGLPISSNPRRLILNPHLITQGGVNGGDVAQGSFTPGVNNQEVVSIKFQSDPTAATIQIAGLTFDKTGSATASDITQFHLYQDGGTLGQYDGADQLLKSVNYSGGTSVTFSDLTNLNVLGANVYILVTVDVAAGADPSHTLGLNLNNPTSIVLADNVYNGPATAITKDNFSHIGTNMDYSLPVELSSFVAIGDYGKIRLKWVTSSEVDNEGFFIYRSKGDDAHFQNITPQIIPGFGTTNETHEYQYIDTDVEEGVTYYYRLKTRDMNGTIKEYPITVSATVLKVPSTFSIAQNYPNPFNPITHFRFTISRTAHASLTVYNVLGQQIKKIFSDKLFEPGVYDQFFWDATDDNGQLVANGIYYYVFEVKEAGFKQIRKMVYLQ